jgi:hypothetical protein
MTLFRTALTIFVAFACGAVTAAVFVSRPIPAPGDAQPAAASASVAAAPSPAAAAPPVAAASSPAPAEERTPAADRPQPRVIPLDRESAQSSGQSSAGAPQTTGAASSGAAGGLGQSAANGPAGAANSCNQNACARAYHSFDSASCTYQPSKGGPRRHCEK